MPTKIVLGLQHGDEGKGRIIIGEYKGHQKKYEDTVKEKEEYSNNRLAST